MRKETANNGRINLRKNKRWLTTRILLGRGKIQSSIQCLSPMLFQGRKVKSTSFAVYHLCLKLSKTLPKCHFVIQGIREIELKKWEKLPLKISPGQIKGLPHAFGAALIID
ncbi:MAG: hypothetical protein V2I46_03065 [Bacteroides sp.]|jgi:hypothetical protein|nr:hypothetical protein [Bacteroides sp.]